MVKTTVFTLLLFFICILLGCQAYHMSSECMSPEGNRIYCHPDTERCDYSGIGCRCQIGAYPVYNHLQGREVCVKTLNDPYQLTFFYISVDNQDYPTTRNVIPIRDAWCTDETIDGINYIQCSNDARKIICNGLGYGVFRYTGMNGVDGTSLRIYVQTEPCICANGYYNSSIVTIAGSTYQTDNFTYVYKSDVIFSNIVNIPARRETKNPLPDLQIYQSSCLYNGCFRGSTSIKETPCGVSVNKLDLEDFAPYHLYQDTSFTTTLYPSSTTALYPAFTSDVLITSSLDITESFDSIAFESISGNVYEMSIRRDYPVYYASLYFTPIENPGFSYLRAPLAEINRQHVRTDWDNVYWTTGWDIKWANLNRQFPGRCLQLNYSVVRYYGYVVPTSEVVCGNVVPVRYISPGNRILFAPVITRTVNLWDTLSRWTNPPFPFQNATYEVYAGSGSTGLPNTLPHTYTQCNYGSFGPDCLTYSGPPCANSLSGINMIIDSGKNATGKCLCTDQTKVFLAGYGCISQSCVANKRTNPTPCSGNGVPNMNTYGLCLCQCNSGYYGMYCEKVLPVALSSTICDCGVKWSTQSDCNSTYNYKILDIGPLKTTDINIQRISTVVGHVNQAKHLCYMNSTCAGFMITSTSLTTTPTNISVYTVWFFGYREENVGPTTIIPDHHCKITPSQTAVYKIDRSTNYACDAFDIDDIPIYYLQNQNQLDTVVNLCKTHKISSLRYNENPSNSLDVECNNPFTQIKYAKFHWQRYGHITRLNPNEKCTLYPTLYDPSTKCAIPTKGCESINQAIPCSGNGYCLPVSATNRTYSCSCKLYGGTPTAGTLFGLKAYTGTACQNRIFDFCVSLNSNFTQVVDPSQTSKFNYCNGQISQCQEGYTDQFGQIKQAGCRCDDNVENTTPWVGTYCERTRCQASSSTNVCNSAEDKNNFCRRDSVNPNGSVNYSCYCGDNFIGANCTTPAPQCKSSVNGLKCAGRGTCLPANPALNKTTPYCQCTTGNFGPTCDQATCPDTLLIPGRGICSNNVFQGCYAVYDGQACARDKCNVTGGSIRPPSPGQPPTQCDCPPDRTAIFSGDPTCYPKCPIDPDSGLECGPGLNKCLQTTTDIVSTRSTICVCAEGYILENGLCKPWCKNGGSFTAGTWNANSPPQCICTPGFTSNPVDRRCTIPSCLDRGTFNVTTGSCTCKKPFYGANDCSLDTCNLNMPASLNLRSKGSVQDYMVGPEKRYKCSCNSPFAPIDVDNPYDCDKPFCGPYGIINPLISIRNISDVFLCQCTGMWRTDCGNNNPLCSATLNKWCSIHNCLNGGFPDAAANPPYSVCKCPVHFTDQFCSTSLCNVQGTASITDFKCICKLNYTGLYCETFQPVVQTVTGSSSSSSSSSSYASIGTNISSTTGSNTQQSTAVAIITSSSSSVPPIPPITAIQSSSSSASVSTPVVSSPSSSSSSSGMVSTQVVSSSSTLHSGTTYSPSSTGSQSSLPNTNINNTLHTSSTGTVNISSLSSTGPTNTTSSANFYYSSPDFYLVLFLFVFVFIHSVFVF